MPLTKRSSVVAEAAPARMTAADRLLQRWRIRHALPWIEDGSRALDVGCADGALFRAAGARIMSGLGIDPAPIGQWPAAWEGRFERRIGTFPDAVGDDGPFDAIVMLAVVEHISEPELKEWARATADLLRPGGRLVITVPSPHVDTLLHWGMRLRLLAGMDAHHHHGFAPSDVPALFGAELTPMTHRTFQLGLNNLFVFRR